MPYQKPKFTSADYAAAPGVFQRYSRFYNTTLDMQDDISSLQDPLPLTERQQDLMLWAKLTRLMEDAVKLYIVPLTTIGEIDSTTIVKLEALATDFGYTPPVVDSSQSNMERTGALTEYLETRESLQNVMSERFGMFCMEMGMGLLMSELMPSVMNDNDVRDKGTQQLALFEREAYVVDFLFSLEKPYNDLQQKLFGKELSLDDIEEILQSL